MGWKWLKGEAKGITFRATMIGQQKTNIQKESPHKYGVYIYFHICIGIITIIKSPHASSVGDIGLFPAKLIRVWFFGSGRKKVNFLWIHPIVPVGGVPLTSQREDWSRWTQAGPNTSEPKEKKKKTNNKEYIMCVETLGGCHFHWMGPFLSCPLLSLFVVWEEALI